MDKMEIFTDTFHVLPEAEYNVAKELYQFGESLNCKIVFKKRKKKDQSINYRVNFNMQKNNKILFWMEVSDNAILVKADLPLNMADDYADKIALRSAKIKEVITNEYIKQCIRCSVGCGGPHLIYTVDNKKYTPCVTSGHYFSQMEEDDWNFLKELLVTKNNA